MRPAIVILAFALRALSQEGNVTEHKTAASDLERQGKSANERIAQLEERIRLMTLQQQGAVQFFQAGQALCEFDKRSAPKIGDDHK